jgi:hypothetical protein
MLLKLAKKKKTKGGEKNTIPINSIFEKRGILSTIFSKSNIKRYN